MGQSNISTWVNIQSASTIWGLMSQLDIEFETKKGKDMFTNCQNYLSSTNRIMAVIAEMPRLIPALLLAGVALINAGCTTVQTIGMKNAFPVAGTAHPSGPVVTVFPVQGVLQGESGPYKADPTYLGEGVRQFFSIFIIPWMVTSDEFHADTPRTDIVRMAILSDLINNGIPAVYQDKGGVDQLKLLPEDRLGITVRIRKLEVDTKFAFIIPLIISNGISFDDTIAHAVLDCQLWQSGSNAPLWEGTGEGSSEADGYLKNAISIAVNQCVSKSGLMETRARLSGQLYAKLMAAGLKQEEGGSVAKALELYGQAYISAIKPEEYLGVTQAMGRLIQSGLIKMALPEEARKFKVQAENAVRDKKFEDAADLYGKALDIAPWWPTTHFNRALVLSEMGDYKLAMLELKNYLMLVPNAPDARAVQDKIYEMESKVNK